MKPRRRPQVSARGGSWAGTCPACSACWTSCWITSGILALLLAISRNWLRRGGPGPAVLGRGALRHPCRQWHRHGEGRRPARGGSQRHSQPAQRVACLIGMVEAESRTASITSHQSHGRLADQPAPAPPERRPASVPSCQPGRRRPSPGKKKPSSTTQVGGRAKRKQIAETSGGCSWVSTTKKMEMGCTGTLRIELGSPPSPASPRQLPPGGAQKFGWGGPLALALLKPGKRLAPGV